MGTFAVSPDEPSNPKMWGFSPASIVPQLYNGSRFSMRTTNPLPVS
jgi:hypothetical protein